MLRSAAASSWQLPGREVLMEKATRRGQPRMGQQDFTYRVGGLGPAKNAEGIAYLRTSSREVRLLGQDLSHTPGGLRAGWAGLSLCLR